MHEPVFFGGKPQVNHPQHSMLSQTLKAQTVLSSWFGPPIFPSVASIYINYWSQDESQEENWWKENQQEEGRAGKQSGWFWRIYFNGWVDTMFVPPHTTLDPDLPPQQFTHHGYSDNHMAPVYIPAVLETCRSIPAHVRTHQVPANRSHVRVWICLCQALLLSPDKMKIPLNLLNSERD